jgi:DNA-binding transcriptional LysR family regulator
MHSELFEMLPDMVLFVAVARAQSFSRAAKTLGMPVSTLSRRVAEFEGKLKVQLFVRTTRHVAMTDIGQHYFQRCQHVLDAAEAAQAALHQDTNAPRGSLRVSLTHDFALAYLVPLLADFSLRYPDITVDLDLTSRSVDLVREGFDIAIRIGSLPDSQLYARRLGTAPLGLFAAPAYLQQRGTLQSPSDLTRHACLRINGPAQQPTRWRLTRGRETETVQVNGPVVANGMSLLVELAAAGLGIISVDQSIAQGAVIAGRMIHVLPEWRPGNVVVHALMPSKTLPMRTKVFLDCLAAKLAIA